MQRISIPAFAHHKPPLDDLSLTELLEQAIDSVFIGVALRPRRALWLPESLLSLLLSDSILWRDEDDLGL